MTRIFSIDPVDTLFFRSGRPFNQDDPGEARADSIFPPYPQTLVGALRAALARGQGWVAGPWDQGLKEVLGDGEDLGELRFHGPYLFRDGERLFPVPAFLFGRRSTVEAGHASWVETLRRLVRV